MYKLKKTLLLAIAITCNSLLFAQYAKNINDPDAVYKSAKEFWQKEQYSLAYALFKQLYNNGNNESNLPVHIYSECKYYTLTLGLMQNDESVLNAALDYSANETNVARADMINFPIAEYYYRHKNYSNAITYYSKVKIDNFTNRELADMKFHQGYCYFTTQQFEKAKPLFNVIRQINSDPNYIDANYYYGFISFYEKRYADAMECFKIVENNDTYKNLVPFYIAEIYYFNGERDKAIDYAEKALKKGNQFYDLQLRQLLGHSYFEKRRYPDALPYLEQYVTKTEKVRREDLYELSYCYYEANNWNKAISGFKQLGGKEDSLAQNSMYLLADSYLKVNDKPSARNAFLFCASNNSNATQKEVSVFNYAKLSYELGYLDIAQNETRDFINNYPKSVYQNEAKELLVTILAKTSNYKEALDLFEKLPQQSENAKKVYPSILYGRAVEYINDQQLVKADELLARILEAPYNGKYVQFVFFWRGEIAYRNSKTDDALIYFVNYLKDPVVNGEVRELNARYNAGYCELKKENYKSALGYFQDVTKTIYATSTLMQQDAFLRAADCYFMLKDFTKASKMYDDIINQSLAQADYALYQKAIIAGASNKVNDKISLLQSLSTRFPNSALVSDANMEIATTYLADEKWADAIPFLDKVLKDKKATALHPAAYLKIGVAYFNLEKNPESLSYFKTLVVKYPNSAESDEAVEYIRKIFVEDQKAGEFITFMKENGKPVTYTEADSLTYKSAQLRYEAKDYANAKAGFAEYVSKFPDGKYAIEANYFSAEINIVNKDFVAALPYYNAVAAKAPNKYAERSALQSARIYYFDNKDYANAEKYFLQSKSLATQQENKLESMRGLLRCQYKLQKWADAVANAQDLLKEKGIASDDKMMANMVIAKSNQLANKLDDAMLAYKSVIAVGKSEFSAEAQYRVAEILLAKGKYADAESAGFDVIKKYGSYEYWVTKSYILLGDVYFAQKDFFNAEATYKSVADNSTIAELKKEASDKLTKTIEEKNKVNKVENQ